MFIIIAFVYITQFSMEIINSQKRIDSFVLDKKLLEVENIQFVIQINGKKKAILSTSKDIDEKTLMDQIKKDDKIGKIFDKKQINKVFFVKNRLINILTK